MEYEFLSGCGGLETTGTAVAVTCVSCFELV